MWQFKLLTFVLYFYIFIFHCLVQASDFPTYYDEYIFNDYYAEGTEDSLNHIVPSNEYKNLIDLYTGTYLEKILRNAFEMSLENIGYHFSASELMKNPIKNERSKYPMVLSCTGLIKELFNRSGIYFEYLESKDMVNLKNLNSSIKDNFEVITRNDLSSEEKKIGFSPKTGDILAFYDSSKKMGHAVIVIDPEKCIGFNSTPYYADYLTKKRNDELEGVGFQIVGESRCKDGKWRAWDNENYQLKALLRHLKLSEKY